MIVSPLYGFAHDMMMKWYGNECCEGAVFVWDLRFRMGWREGDVAIIRSEEFPLNKQISPPIVNCPPLALSHSHQTPEARS